MAEVILADLVHPHCSQSRRCVEERVRKLLSEISSRASEPVYMLVQQRARGARELVRQCAALRSRLTCFSEENLAALLYSMKRAADERGASSVHVVTCPSRLAELRVCQKQLFTQTYSFRYSAVLDCTACPAAELTSSAQLARVEEQISGFLQRLPALRGDITILKSPLISGALPSLYYFYLRDSFTALFTPGAPSSSNSPKTAMSI